MAESAGWESILYLENGRWFEGLGFGARASCGGEIVFNTGMTGYQEILTDPSYYRQIVVMTYPHLGNTGTNREDLESQSLYLSGVVTREYSACASSWRSEETLHDYLAKARIPGISEVDTREITRLIRNEGSQRAIILPKETAGNQIQVHAQALLEAVPAMEGLELVSQVSCSRPYEFSEQGPSDPSRPCIVVYDFGVKRNILRHFQRRGFRVEVVPYDFPSEEALAYHPVAVVLSNGPGDPALVPINNVQALIGKVPLFAVCMGHQVLARALGGTTYKLKFGHHGINHPVKDHVQERIIITSQNHGFAVEPKSLQREGLSITCTSLNDGTVEGFVSEKVKAVSYQFHPEARPGPNDAGYLFDDFLKRYVQ